MKFDRESDDSQKIHKLRPQLYYVDDSVDREFYDELEEDEIVAETGCLTQPIKLASLSITGYDSLSPLL